MKAKEVFYLLGLKPKPKRYGYRILQVELPQDGCVSYAEWLHPRNVQTPPSQAAVDALREYVRPGDVAIDIGAQTGDTTLPMALAVGASGCVLALEPNECVFPVVKATSELNREKTSIIPLMFAATAEDGDYEFEYGDSGFLNGGMHEGVSRWRHGSAFKLRVKGRNPQRFLEQTYPELVPRIRLIKVDTEGHDLAVLGTLTQTIAQARPFIRAEVFKLTNGEQRRQLHRFLADRGYDVFKFGGDAGYRGVCLAESDMMKWPHYDIFCIPR